MSIQPVEMKYILIYDLKYKKKNNQSCITK